MFGNSQTAWCPTCNKRLMRPGDELCAACQYEHDQKQATQSAPVQYRFTYCDRCGPGVTASVLYESPHARVLELCMHHAKVMREPLVKAGWRIAHTRANSVGVE